MQEKILFTTILPSYIHNDEIVKELVKLSKEQNYPVEKAKLYKKLEKYAGFGTDYMVTAKKKPPIPGGWDIEITSFVPEQKQVMLNVDLQEENGKKVGVVNKLVLKMLEEYQKEGLVIEIEEEPKEFYGNWVRVLKASGHPIVLEQLEDFVENMR